MRVVGLKRSLTPNADSAMNHAAIVQIEESPDAPALIINASYRHRLQHRCASKNLRAAPHSGGAGSGKHGPKNRSTSVVARIERFRRPKRPTQAIPQTLRYYKRIFDGDSF